MCGYAKGKFRKNDKPVVVRYARGEGCPGRPSQYKVMTVPGLGRFWTPMSVINEVDRNNSSMFLAIAPRDALDSEFGDLVEVQSAALRLFNRYRDKTESWGMGRLTSWMDPVGRELVDYRLHQSALALNEDHFNNLGMRTERVILRYCLFLTQGLDAVKHTAFYAEDKKLISSLNRDQLSSFYRTFMHL